MTTPPKGFNDFSNLIFDNEGNIIGTITVHSFGVVHSYTPKPLLHLKDDDVQRCKPSINKPGRRTRWNSKKR